MSTLEFNSRYNQLEALLFSFAMKLTKNREDAKDLLQETVTRAYANRMGFAPGTNFKAWITTIMRNSFINEYRKRRTRNNVEQPLENNTQAAMKKAVGNQAPNIIMMQELRTMLDRLNAEHQVPFEMFFNGYEYQEIADTLKIPMGTVKSRIFFARKMLKDMIHNHYGENVRRA